MPAMAIAGTRFFSWYLTKYVYKEVLFSFIAGTSIFLLIMLMFQVIRLSEFVVEHHVAIQDVGRLSLYLMLSFLPLAVPVAFLFAVLMGISRANSEGEILALQVNGISLGQIFAPLAGFSVLVSSVCLYTSLYTVPRGNRAFELLITKLGNERVMAALKPGVFMEGFYGLVLFAEQIIPIKNEMKRIFIYDERDEGHPLAITAQAGLLKTEQEKGYLTLRLTNGAIHVEKKQAAGIQQKIEFDVYDINLELAPTGDNWRAYSPPSFNYEQLKHRIQETLHDPPQHRQLQVELHRRFSLSFACIVFAALGFFIGTNSQRGVRSAAILLCLLVALVYWISYLAANALAVEGWLIPWFGIWLPNALFLGVAYWSYRRYGRG